jgi:hypothetical protein
MSANRSAHQAYGHLKVFSLAFQIIWGITLSCYQLTFRLTIEIIRLPFTMLFALCGRHYVVRRNGKTSWVSVWRYW